jgi:hypothetical protein
LIQNGGLNIPIYKFEGRVPLTRSLDLRSPSPEEEVVLTNKNAVAAII